MQNCTHQGFHSGQGRYDADRQLLRYVVVCDACHAELREVDTQLYRPEYDPRGNDAFIHA